ncbi:MAG: dockerin type I repeat-containing protein, partial [Clostridia bacterium]|nr:dockerin type I repeat-containing protein [Clostridia bacterium]
AEETVTSGFAFSGFDSAAEGEKTVTVTYGAFSAAFTVTVKCSHTAKTLTPAKAATCKEGGWDAYYTCEPCGRIFAEDGTTELKEIPTTEKDASKHEYDGSEDLICNICGAERPAYIVGDVDGNGALDMDDAIYLLFHCAFPEDYPVNQDFDFNSDGKVDMDDATRLLYHVFFPERYSLR